jgi:cyclopropane fatty-acyl-phospholipid synthase-like methyltransferase
MRRLTYWLSYLTGGAGWDTGITPPEIVDLIEVQGVGPGRAVDLGCGTGTNVIYLARHGWDAVGIDFVPQPIRLARRKARRAGVAERTQFIAGDVRKLASLGLDGSFDLVVDIGCGHGLPLESRPDYAANLARLVKPGGLFMLYAFCAAPGRLLGFSAEMVEELFAPAFVLEWSNIGEDTSARSASAWFRLRRVDPD